MSKKIDCKMLTLVLILLLFLLGFAEKNFARDLSDYRLEETLSLEDKERILSSKPGIALPEIYKAIEKPHWEEFFFARHCADHLGQPIAYDLINLFKKYLLTYPEAFSQIIANLPERSDAELVAIFTVFLLSNKKDSMLIKILPAYFNNYSDILRLRAIQLYANQDVNNNEVRETLKKEWLRVWKEIAVSTPVAPGGCFPDDISIELVRTILEGMLQRNWSYGWNEAEKMFQSNIPDKRGLAASILMKVKTNQNKCVKLLKKYFIREQNNSVRVEIGTSLSVLTGIPYNDLVKKYLSEKK